MRSGCYRERALAALFLAVSLAVSAPIAFILSDYDTAPPGKDEDKEDIYFSYVEGGRILRGENPYARIFLTDLRTNQKNSTYLPGFYLLSALTQRAGLAAYEDWIRFWRVVFFAASLATATVLFVAGNRAEGPLLGALAGWLWLFGRWTLHTVKIAHLDPLAIVFLTLALAALPRRPVAACALFGVSLAIKHVAALLGPVFLIAAIRAGAGRIPGADEHGRAATGGSWMNAGGMRGFAAMAATPALVSAPFLIWNAKAFVLSVMFSLTRSAGTHFEAPSATEILGLEGAAARLLMAALTILVYGLAWKGRLGPRAASLAVMAIFLDFNSVLFEQYLTWLAPPMGMALIELAETRKSGAVRR